MFDHISIGVANLDRAALFYDAVLAPLGYVQLWRHPRAVGYGPNGFKGEAPFALVDSGTDPKPMATGFHLAFAATSREVVARFHQAALDAGGINEGAPGIRANYDEGYYAAFIRDLDGHRLEAVVHEQNVASASG